MINLHTNFEVSAFTHYEDMKGVVWGLGIEKRSPAMPPFDKAHTTYYSTLLKTMRLPCAFFEL